MRPLKALAIAVTLVLIFASGAITAGVRHWFQPIVTVKLANKSGQSIVKLVVTVGTNGYKSTIDVRPLQIDEEQAVPFVLAGEGSYQIHATLADGTILTGGAGYVEAGYTARETILATKVESKYLYSSWISIASERCR